MLDSDRGWEKVNFYVGDQEQSGFKLVLSRRGSERGRVRHPDRRADHSRGLMDAHFDLRNTPSSCPIPGADKIAIVWLVPITPGETDYVFARHRHQEAVVGKGSAGTDSPVPASERGRGSEGRRWGH